MLQRYLPGCMRGRLKFLSPKNVDDFESLKIFGVISWIVQRIFEILCNRFSENSKIQLRGIFITVPATRQRFNH